MLYGFRGYHGWFIVTATYGQVLNGNEAVFRDIKRRFSGGGKI